MEEAIADHLRPLDRAFLFVEDGVTHMHIGACAIFAGPPPDDADVVALIAAKLPELGHYRQRIRMVPAQLGRPVWVDDPQFDLAHHVRRTVVPAPGGDEGLCRLMGELMAVELDRHRPLWELWMVDGLSEHRWALIFKVHHCMADGISGTDLLATLLDTDPTPPPVARGVARRPAGRGGRRPLDPDPGPRRRTPCTRARASRAASSAPVRRHRARRHRTGC